MAQAINTIKDASWTSVERKQNTYISALKLYADTNEVSELAYSSS